MPVELKRFNRSAIGDEPGDHGVVSERIAIAAVGGEEEDRNGVVDASALGVHVDEGSDRRRGFVEAIDEHVTVV